MFAGTCELAPGMLTAGLPITGPVVRDGSTPGLPGAPVLL
jgi:hypothetical protein